MGGAEGVVTGGPLVPLCSSPTHIPHCSLQVGGGQQEGEQHGRWVLGLSCEEPQALHELLQRTAHNLQTCPPFPATVHTRVCPVQQTLSSKDFLDSAEVKASRGVRAEAAMSATAVAPMVQSASPGSTGADGDATHASAAHAP